MFDAILGGGGNGTGAHRLMEAEVWADWALRAGIALLIAAVGIWLSKRLARALGRGLQRVGVEQILRDFLTGIAYAIGIVVVLVAALDAIGVPTTSLLAVLGAAGLAIGLALKDSLANIASGVMLIVLRPFRAGDAVLIAGQEGIVEHVRIFQTHLRTAQNHDVILPNSQITAGPIVNFTARPQRRIDIALNVGYGEDLGRVRALLLALASANTRVLPTPPVDVAVGALGDHAVSVHLHAWVATADHGPARSELLEAIRETFARENIALQLPRRELALVSGVATGP
jgi:small conductance mechanosensitive channel